MNTVDNMLSYTKNNIFWGIAAAHLDNDLKLANYNSEGDEILDFHCQCRST